jgi:hypothetical protein
MQLQPKDLGTKWHTAIVRYRALGTARIHTPPHIGRLGRLWSTGSDVPEEVTAATLPMMADQTGPLVSGLGTIILLIGTVVGIWLMRNGSVLNLVQLLPIVLAGLFLSYIVLPRRVFRRMHAEPVNYEELDALKGIEARKEEEVEEKKKPRGLSLMRLFASVRGTHGSKRNQELERTFLSLVQDALSARDLSPSAEAELRRVLKSIGEAIGSLPPEDSDEDEELSDVVVDAEMLAARAAREKDEIAAASLLRQAEANLTRARSMQNNKRLARRVRILRDEMLAQVKMVRSLLPTLKSDTASLATDSGRFAAVAASVQSIATEAASVADAREELSRSLWQTESAEPQIVQVGVRGGH